MAFRRNVENSCHAQHTENDKPGQKKSRNDREQIHNTIKRNEKTDRGFGLAHSPDCDKNIKSAAEAVALVANLNNVKDFFPS